MLQFDAVSKYRYIHILNYDILSYLIGGISFNQYRIYPLTFTIIHHLCFEYQCAPTRYACTYNVEFYSFLPA